MKNIIIICLVFIFVSCDDLFKITVQVKFDQKTFTEQRRLWQQSNIKNYQYQLSAIGFIPYNGTIFVENGQFKNDLPSGEYFYIGNFQEYSTIDEIYKTIEELYNIYNNTKQSKKDVYCTEIFIEYDKTNHIPIKIRYYYYCPPNVALDGTFYYEITEFSKSD